MSKNGSRRRAPGSAYWVISKSENTRMRMLTIDRDGREALPVFGFEEEAAVFLESGTFGSRWRLRETTAGELLSILHGPCKNVEWVDLDPLPAVLAGGRWEILLLSRVRFAAFLMRKAGIAPIRTPRGYGDPASAR